MSRHNIQTSIVVHGSEIDTHSKLGDVYTRLERKLACRVGYPVRYEVEQNPIRNRIVWKSSRDCYEITLTAVMKNGKWVRDEWMAQTDGDRHNRPEVYAERERLYREEMAAIIADHQKRRLSAKEALGRK